MPGRQLFLHPDNCVRPLAVVAAADGDTRRNSPAAKRDEFASTLVLERHALAMVIRGTATLGGRRATEESDG